MTDDDGRPQKVADDDGAQAADDWGELGRQLLAGELDRVATDCRVELERVARRVEAGADLEASDLEASSMAVREAQTMLGYLRAVAVEGTR